MITMIYFCVAEFLAFIVQLKILCLLRVQICLVIPDCCPAKHDIPHNHYRRCCGSFCFSYSCRGEFDLSVVAQTATNELM